MKNPKAKGASFEREIAVNLSKWASFGEREDLFWRSSMSGGRATVARKKGGNLEAVIGDLCAIHPDGKPFLDKFYVELKHYKDLNYSGILTKTGHLMRFWESTITEANSYKRNPMLIAKQNRLPTIVFLQTSGLRLLELIEAQTIILSHRNGMYGYLLSDFVKYAQPV